MDSETKRFSGWKREADLQVQDSDIYQGEFSTESGEKG